MSTENPEPDSAVRGENPWSHVPPAPMTIRDTGIPDSFLRELVLKTVWMYDKPSLSTLSEVTGLHSAVVDELVDGLKREGLCEVESQEAGQRIHFRYRPTDRGKAAAHEAMDRSRYVGVAPVPVSAYNDVVSEQVRRFRRPSLHEIRTALEHMVLPEYLVKELGQAFFSRRALMVFGPSGNGKTEIVTSIAKVVAGTIVIPYALYGHGQLIRVFDPEVHFAQDDSSKPARGILADESARRDRRWLPVNRPTVMVAGNMGAEALEMAYDAMQGTHKAPLSVVAQGGVLIIDDLGRQRVSPKEILNRWVVMMEQGYDSFALSTSEIVRLPLDVTLIFSTNLTVQDLMDEAYLRRIAYKIAIPDPDQAQLAEIARRFCDGKGIKWSEDSIQYLIERLFAPGLPKPRGCYPRDIITTVIDEAEFDGREPAFDRESIHSACRMYFGTEAESHAA
jgi:predicted ATPase with chaperone activity